MAFKHTKNLFVFAFSAFSAVKSAVNRDRLTKARRSWNMSRIRGKHTTPERVVRSLLHQMGYRFRLHARIPIAREDRNRKSEVRRQTSGLRPATSNRNGRKKAQTAQKLSFTQLSTLNPQPSQRRFITPDIVLVRHRVAIFVHGCFWHRHRGCKNCTTPTHRREWWLNKLEGNAARDKLHQRALRKLGWRVIVIWECQTERPETLARLSRKLSNLTG